MADDSIPKQHFHVRDIPTKTVTLYPARAHIVREIANISLQPGQNEIEVYGFATTIDEQSLQIEGTGDASSVTITDITVDQVPNKEKFEDLHDSYEDELSEPEDYEDSDDDASTVKQAKLKYNDLQTRLNKASDEHDSASHQLTALDSYLGSLKAEHSDAKNFLDSVNAYDQQRKRVDIALAKAASDKAKLQKESDRAQWELTKAKKAEAAKNRETTKAKEKQRQKKLRERQERKNEIDRKNAELRKFFPAKVYRIVVRLETALDTPASSRPSSIAAASSADETAEKALDKSSSSASVIGLSISYVTTGSYWIPRYDFIINSMQKRAQITYRAEIFNATSETWKDAKIILSTSQTSYSGLEDKVPTMTAWQVLLTRGMSDDAVMSRAEMLQHYSAQEIALASHYHGRRPPHGTGTAKMAIGASSHGRKAPRKAPATGGFTAREQEGFGSANVQASRSAGASSAASDPTVFKSSRDAYVQPKADNSAAYGEDEDEGEAATLSEQPPLTQFDFEESVWEDNGLTATYDLPGKRTLAPSSLGRRHKIAVLTASNIFMNHIVVPKLKAAAFLRAKIRNPSSSVTLLQGHAGITLDGSFLGNIPLQRVSPNQVFEVPLGVDPAIQVSYPKPTLHRSTQGIFNKEHSHVFTRSITISNTKPMPVDLTILDQVPVSEDERLRIDIIEPRGLSQVGDSARSGEAPAEAPKKPWGQAKATYKKDGEVCWTAQIDKGSVCVIKFEYEARMPAGEAMANA